MLSSIFNYNQTGIVRSSNQKNSIQIAVKLYVDYLKQYHINNHTIIMKWALLPWGWRTIDLTYRCSAETLHWTQYIRSFKSPLSPHFWQTFIWEEAQKGYHHNWNKLYHKWIKIKGSNQSSTFPLISNDKINLRLHYLYQTPNIFAYKVYVVQSAKNSMQIKNSQSKFSYH